MGRNLSAANIHDAGKNPPPRRTVIDAEGVPRTEKIPALLHEKWVKPCGNVVRLPLVTAAALRNPNNPAALRARETMQRKGGIPYGKCPAQTLVGLPDGMRGELPCEPRTYSENKCCVHVERIIKARLAAHAAKQAAMVERMKPPEARKVELLEEQHQAFLRAQIDTAKPTIKASKRSRGDDSES